MKSAIKSLLYAIVLVLGSFMGMNQAHSATIESFGVQHELEGSNHPAYDRFSVSAIPPWEFSVRVDGPEEYSAWIYHLSVRYDYRSGMYYQAERDWNMALPDGEYSLQLYEDRMGDPVDTMASTFSYRDIAIVDISSGTPANDAYINTVTPEFAWTGISESEITPYYQLHIAEYGEEDSAVYISELGTATSVTVPAGFLLSGASYRWQIKTYDSNSEMASNISVSDWSYFTISSDNPGDAPLTLDHAYMRSRVKANGAKSTQIGVGFTGPSPLDSTVQVTGPIGESSETTYTLDHSHYWQGGTLVGFYLSPNEQLDDGTYEFTISDNRAGGTPITFSRTLQANWSQFLVDEDSVNLNDDWYLDTTEPTITWSVVPGISTYRLQIYSYDWKTRIYSIFTSNTEETIPENILKKNTAYQVRIETFDGTDDPFTSGSDHGNRGSGGSESIYIVNDNAPASISGNINPGTSGAGGPIFVVIRSSPTFDFGEDYGYTMLDAAGPYTIHNVPRQKDLYIHVLYDKDGSESYSVGDFTGLYSTSPVNLPADGAILTGYDVTLSTEVAPVSVSGSITCSAYTSGAIYIGVSSWCDEEPYALTSVSSCFESYSIDNVPAGGRACVKAYWDADGSGSDGPSAFDHNGEYANNPLLIPDSGATDIDITIQTTGFISGYVKDSENNPVENLHLYVEDSSSGDRLQGTETNEDGFYVFPIEEGSYQVRACAKCNSMPFIDQWRYSISVTDLETTTVDFTMTSGGTISGRVTEDDGETPISGLVVDARDYSTDDFIGSGTTDDDGYYTIDLLAPGSYRVLTCTDCDGLPYVNEYYDDTNWDNAAEVVVTDGEDTPDIDFQLISGGTISGRVTESDGETPITDLVVEARDPTTSDFIESARTDDDGYYAIRVAPGNYKVTTCADCDGLPYVNEYYDDTNWDNATEVVVTDGEDTPDIDFQLISGGTISGRVTEDDGETPITDLIVEARDPTTSDFIESARTDDDGYYAIRVAPGNYKVTTCADRNGLPYVNEYYDDTNWDNATEVVVTDGEDTPDIDFQLISGGTISGRVTESDGETPITDLIVDARDSTTGDFIEGARTDDDGYYAIRVAPGNYKVTTCAECYGDHPYVNEYYDDTNWDNAAEVVVSDGVDTPDIDFQLIMIIPGDINRDESVDLKDLILGLQVLTGEQPSAPVFSTGNARGDDSIGMEDVLYILQNI